MVLDLAILLSGVTSNPNYKWHILYANHTILHKFSFPSLKFHVSIVQEHIASNLEVLSNLTDEWNVFVWKLGSILFTWHKFYSIDFGTFVTIYLSKYSNVCVEYRRHKKLVSNIFLPRDDNRPPYFIPSRKKTHTRFLNETKM